MSTIGGIARIDLLHCLATWPFFVILYKKMPFTALAFSTFSRIRSSIVLKTTSLFRAIDDADDGALVVLAAAVFDFFTSFKST